MRNTKNVDKPNSWLAKLLGAELPDEEGQVLLNGQRYLMRNGILRSSAVHSTTQQQTSQVFGFKWHKEDTYDSEQMRRHITEWTSKYGDMLALVRRIGTANRPIVLDAGCGSGVTGFELFGPIMSHINYLGVDVSNAVDVAQSRARRLQLTNVQFMQADLLDIPLADESVDLLYSEGVLHHTDSTERALKKVARHLKPGGFAIFYVYRKKGPIREFTDDYIRARLAAMTPEEAWAKLMPLTKLGVTLGKLDIDIDIEEPIDFLEIPAGKINLQRFFYWHVFKAFYRSDFPLDEMHHINFDWFAPANAHRQTPEQVRAWCNDCGLEVEREILEEAGISIVARKRGGERYSR